MARSVGSAAQPLTVVRHEEVVVIAPVRGDVAGLVDALTVAHDKLVGDGIVLAIGVSTVHDDLQRMDDAYGEAVTALERVRPMGGVAALPALSAFDCLALFGLETARRRIPTAIRQFVADDLADGGVLTTTLLEYVACDFKTKVAAERLFVHPNTVRYRPGKIEERTPRSPRRRSRPRTARWARSASCWPTRGPTASTTGCSPRSRPKSWSAFWTG